MKQKHCYLSAAKLNLFLHITGKRQDGYHNLQSVFCRLDFGDFLTFEVHKGSQLIVLSGADTLTDCLDDNLIIKAAYALYHYGQAHAIGKIVPIHITLDKRLPVGAGLGGGSSNAATTLMALNRLWQLNLDQKTLLALGKSLGADVPFFLFDQSYAICEGIGERLTAIDLPACRYLVLCPPVHHNTRLFFANEQLKKDSALIDHQILVECYQHFLYQLKAPFYNAFEKIAQQSLPVAQAFDYLHGLSVHTQSTPRLTGTGSAVFLPIPYTMDDITLAQWQKKAPYFAFVACSQ